MIKQKKQRSSIEIDLTGPQGNAFCLLGYASDFYKQMGRTSDQIDALMEDMKSSDYEHLVKVFIEEFGSLCTLYR
jgi:hypothetical protein